MSNLSRNSGNPAIMSVYGEDINAGKLVIFYDEASSGGHTSLYCMQECLREDGNAIQEGVSLTLSSFSTVSPKIVKRAIATVPDKVATDHNLKAGTVTDKLQIVIKRQAGNPFFSDKAEQTGALNQVQAVVNPTNGMVSTYEGKPVFEFVEVQGRGTERKVHSFAHLRDSESAPMTKQEAFEYVLNEFPQFAGVESFEFNLRKTCQLSATTAEIESVPVAEESEA